MDSIETWSNRHSQIHEMDAIQTAQVLDRQNSNSKDKTDNLGAAEALGELAQSACNPNIRYEDQADYIEGGFGWAIVFCGSLVVTGGFQSGSEPWGNSSQARS